MFRLTKFVVRFSIAAALIVSASGSIAADTIKIGWLSSLTGALSSAAIAENQEFNLLLMKLTSLAAYWVVRSNCSPETPLAIPPKQLTLLSN